MPKRNRSKNMRGGILGFFEGEKKQADGNEEKGWMDSATGMFSSAKAEPVPVNPAVPAAEPAVPANPAVPAAEPVDYSNPAVPAYGGRRRRRKSRRTRKSRRMRGGYSDNVSMTNLASRAAPFSGETARPQAYVGGRRTKRRCHTHKRSRRRHCRK